MTAADDLHSLLAGHVIDILAAADDRIDTADSADLLNLVAVVHRLARYADRYADDLLLELRNPNRSDQPSLRTIAHRLGLHHSTLDQRIRNRAARRLNTAKADLDPKLLREHPVYLTTQSWQADGRWICHGYEMYPLGEWPADTDLDVIQREAAATIHTELHLTVYGWRELYAADDDGHEDPYYVAITDPLKEGADDYRARGVQALAAACREAGTDGITVRAARQKLIDAGILTPGSFGAFVRILSVALAEGGIVQPHGRRGKLYIAGSEPS